MQILYHWEVGRVDIGQALDTFWSLQWPGEADARAADAADGTDGGLRAFASALAQGTVEHLADLDSLIEDATEHWRLSRMPVVDRLILRMAAYELSQTPDTPSPVVINEALELARTFCAEDSVKFINGLLDGIRKKLDGTR